MVDRTNNSGVPPEGDSDDKARRPSGDTTGCHQALGASPERRGRTTVPTSRAIVRLGRLEQQLIIVALWALEASGRITITSVDPDDVTGILLPELPSATAARLGLGPRHRPRAKPAAFTLRFTPVGIPGEAINLETWLLAATGGRKSDLNDLINGGSLYSGYLSLNGLIVIPQREAIRQGALRTSKRNRRLVGSLQWSARLPDYVMAPRSSDELERSFEEMKLRFHEWVGTHAELRRKLSSECAMALFNARPRPPSDAGPG
jgi:hypothetical protein